jgi:hypothetical protein
MIRRRTSYTMAMAGLVLIALVPACRDKQPPSAPLIAPSDRIAFDAEEGSVGFDGKYTNREKQSGGFTHIDQAAVKGNLVVGYHYFSNGTTTGGWAWTGTIAPDPTNPTRGTITGIGTKNDLCCGSINFTLTNGGIVRYPDGSATLFYGSTDPRFGDFGSVAYRHGEND